MPVSSQAVQSNHHSAFQRFVLPGLAFKAVVIGGGYATGREIAEFFLPAGPWGGIAAMAVATAVWCVVCSTTFVFARRLRERDYRSFFRALLGRAWPVFEIAYVIFVVLILAVVAAGDRLRHVGAPPPWHVAWRHRIATLLNKSREQTLRGPFAVRHADWSALFIVPTASRRPSQPQVAGTTDGWRAA
jgi:L-asparagine transporter-like permease